MVSDITMNMVILESLLILSSAFSAADGFAIGPDALKVMTSGHRAHDQYSQYDHKLLTAADGKLQLSEKCLLCRIVIPSVRIMLRAGLSFDEVSNVFANGCATLHLESRDVCAGITSQFQDETLTVLQNSTLTSAEVCSFIVGDSCPSDFDDRFMWNVTLPNIPKPPFVPPVPPARNAPRIRVLHLSDIHVDFRYRIGSNAACGKPLCCQDDELSSSGEFASAGKWGAYNCDTPVQTLINLFEHLSTEETFDYIIWTGDQTSHRVWDFSRSEALHTLDFITKLFMKYFPGVPVFPALGNHESVPVNSFPPAYIVGNRSIEWLYDALVKNWTHWLTNNTVFTIERGGFYTHLLKPGFRIVSLNMNYCNKENFWLVFNITDPMGQLEWLISVLLNAEKVGEKVHIIGHIAPGCFDCLKWWSWNYYAIVNRFEGVIAAQFFGHTHDDSWEMFYDISDGFQRPVSVAYVSPSVTPFANLNNGYRVYVIDGLYPKSSWAVLDHETYIMNLTEANLLDHPRWIKEYSAKETYNMTSLTPADWNEVLKKMMTDTKLFNTYYRLYHKLYPTLKVCDEKCRMYMLCEVKSGRSHDSHLCKDLFGEKTSEIHYRHFLSWFHEKKVC